MKKFNINYKILLLYCCIPLLTYYSFSSMISVIRWFSEENKNKAQVLILNNELEQMEGEIEVLKNKVQGLQEPTLNKELLEYQAKNHLNMIKAGEIILIE